MGYIGDGPKPELEVGDISTKDVTATGDLTVDTNTLFVDASENKVGVGTTTVTDAGVTITPSTLTSEGTVEVCIPDNPNATTVLKTEDNVDYINTEDSDRIRTEGGTVELITLTVTYTFTNGTQATNQIYIQQQP